MGSSRLSCTFSPSKSHKRGNVACFRRQKRLQSLGTLSTLHDQCILLMIKSLGMRCQVTPTAWTSTALHRLVMNLPKIGHRCDFARPTGVERLEVPLCLPFGFTAQYGSTDELLNPHYVGAVVSTIC